MIAFVILHYQAIDETMNCIESIRKNIAGDYKIIVVDNASPNRTGIKLVERYEDSLDVEIIINKENVGFAKGNNLGYKKAKEYNPDFIVVLNSDTLLIKEDFVEKLNYAYDEYHFDVLGPDIYSTRTKSHQNPQREENYTMRELVASKNKLLFKNRFRWLLKIKYFFNGKSEQILLRNEKDFNCIKIGTVLHGAFYVFSRQFILKHDNCFYNNTFMFYESYILHYFGCKEGMIFLYYPEIKVLHHEDASTDSTFKTQYKKSVFVNKCLLDSCDEFIRVMNTPTATLG